MIFLGRCEAGGKFKKKKMEEGKTERGERGDREKETHTLSPTAECLLFAAPRD